MTRHAGLRFLLACTFGLFGCSTTPDSSRDGATPGADRARGVDAQPTSDRGARNEAAAPREAAVAADSASAPDARRDGPPVVGDGPSAGGGDGGGQQSARIDFVVGGSISVKAHNCSGLYGTWNGTMVVSGGGGSGQGTFTLPIDPAGAGSFSWSFPVATSGGTVLYTGVGQATLQAGGTAMKADVTVTVITSVGNSSGSFTETVPILRGGFAACGGN